MRNILRPVLVRTLTSTVMTAGAMALLSSQASAQSIGDMQKQLETLQSQIADLQQQMESAKTDEAANGSDWTVKWKGAPEIASTDGAYKMKLRGRMLLDFATGSQDNAVTGADGLSATEVRAARLGIEGVIEHDFKYKFEADLASNEVELTDAYISFGGLPLDIKVGQFKTPNSLEELTSSRFTTFMERGSITDAFELSRQLGVSIGMERDAWTLTGGVFKGSAGTDNTDDGLTLAARATVAPKFGENGLVHLGVSIRYRENGDDQGLFRYRQRPHQHTADRFVDTDSFADSDLMLGAEAAVLYGPFSLQGEYMTLSADNADPSMPDADFDGYYVSGSWFLTGEARTYDAGAFERVKVNSPVFDGGAGAWEVAARFDTVDLTDGAIIGGTQDTYIVGVNWYLGNYVRLMANYNKSKVKGGTNDGADIDLFGLRAQIDW
jgi:phosphate-selective porin OprO/OprP